MGGPLWKGRQGDAGDGGLAGLRGGRESWEVLSAKAPLSPPPPAVLRRPFPGTHMIPPNDRRWVRFLAPVPLEGRGMRPDF